MTLAPNASAREAKMCIRDRDGSEAEMEEAAQIAQAEEFISHKKDVYKRQVWNR